MEVDRFFASSKTCHVCLNRVDSLALEVRQWECQNCGTHHDRDINAAQNIKNEALRILSLGISDRAWVGNIRELGKTSVLLNVPLNQEASSSPMAGWGSSQIVLEV
ncbi:zinc ribbon domain-containing protein [Spirulina subsalsa]|uniref:zinc ribbon domain-containing protein n=1 Tax=Spirulina subsalsa TaxID=54311 RepID=UPI0009FF9446